jgi:hypothetical protein
VHNRITETETTQMKTLAKEIWTAGTGAEQTRYTLVAKQFDNGEGAVTIFTNEADFVTGYAGRLVERFTSCGRGLPGLRSAFIAARCVAKGRGLERVRAR